MALFECKNVVKKFDTCTALDGVNLSFDGGKIVGLLGPNGSGKTTLIKLVAGLITPTSGEILINGLNPGVNSKKIVSYLPDRISLPEWMCAEQLEKYCSDFFADFSAEKADKMFADLSVDKLKPIKNLSKGTREKIQLILTMSRNAMLYLLDEPIGGVDPATRDYILTTIVSNYNPNSLVIISTHLISDVESVLNDVIFLKNGKIDLVSSVSDVLSNSGKTVDELFREVFKC